MTVSSYSNMAARNTGLDVLRFAAIVLVIGRHSGAAPRVAFIEPVAEAWRRGGWVGVDLFFVLSGFLISGLLFSEFRKTGRIDVRKFLVRRGWKIYPAFLVLIALTVEYQKFHHTGNSAELVAEVTFMQSYFAGIWPHTWSLSVEEHFYLALPFVLIACFRPRAENAERRLLLALLTVAVACLLVRLMHARAEPYAFITHAFPSYLRIDSLGFGVALSYAYHFRSEFFRRVVAPNRLILAIIGCVLMTPAFVWDIQRTPYLYTFGFTVIYIGCGMLVAASVLTNFSNVKPAKWAAEVGVFSYSIYLWHIPYLTIVLPWLEKMGLRYPAWAWPIIFVGGSIVLGIAMAKLVEIPALRVRDQFYPRNAKPLATAGSYSLEHSVALL